jgi:hypothetical protein
MPKKITSEELNKVLEGHFWFGKNSNQAAEAAGISQQVASGIIRTFQLMRNGDIEGLVQEAAVNEKISAQTVKLVAERIGEGVPEEVLQAILERQRAKTERLRNARAEAPAEEETPPSPAQAPATPPLAGEGRAAAPGNDALYFIRILEELHQQNELLRDLLDVVIPKWAGDLKDNQNANSDVLAGLLKEQGQALDAIRCNTRKRGL